MAIEIHLEQMMRRRRVGLVELAERIDLTPANLSRIKCGKARALRLDTLEKLCRELKCQPGDLIVHRHLE